MLSNLAAPIIHLTGSAVTKCLTVQIETVTRQISIQEVLTIQCVCVEGGTGESIGIKGEGVKVRRQQLCCVEEHRGACAQPSSTSQ